MSDDEDDGADNDDEVEIMSTDENANEINAPVDLEDEEAPEEADTIPDPEVQDEDDDEDALSDGAVAGLRRSRRRRRLRQPTVIDFDNRLSNVNEGVLHINPAVLEQTKESFKILDNNRPMEEQTSPRVAVRAPRSAGIDPKALELLFGPKKLPSAGETSDAVVLHVVGVILAQQYTVNKGLKLFGERAKESISKELQQLHDYVTYTPVHAHDERAEEGGPGISDLSD